MPDLIREAIEEVQQATQALIAGSALGAISASTQHLASVERDAILRGPIGIYLLTVAESGERKSTVDNLFTAPIRNWEQEQVKASKDTQAEYRARMNIWEATDSRAKCFEPTKPKSRS